MLLSASAAQGDDLPVLLLEPAVKADDWRWRGVDLKPFFEQQRPPRPSPLEGLDAPGMGDFEPFLPVRPAVPAVVPARPQKALRQEVGPDGKVRVKVIEVRGQDGARVRRVIRVVQPQQVAIEGRDAWLTTILRTRDVERFRKEQEQRLNALIERIDQNADLPLETLQKLQLAGQGDLSRFLGECEAVVSAATEKEAGEEERAVLLQRALLLRTTYQAGLHRRESLFTKMLKSLLDAEQMQQVEPLLEVEARRVRVEGAGFF